MASSDTDERLADDLLEGGAAIADFLFPASDTLERKVNQKKVYRYAATARNPLPIFRMGSTMCARKSTLRRWIERQEGLPL